MDNWTRSPPIFALPSSLRPVELMERVVGRLYQEEAQQRLTQHYTESIEAWRLFLDGSFHWDKQEQGSNQEGDPGLRGRRAHRSPCSRCRAGSGLAERFGSVRASSGSSASRRVRAGRARAGTRSRSTTSSRLHRRRWTHPGAAVAATRRAAAALPVRMNSIRITLGLSSGSGTCILGRLPALVETRRAQSLEPMRFAFAAMDLIRVPLGLRRHARPASSLVEAAAAGSAGARSAPSSTCTARWERLGIAVQVLEGARARSLAELDLGPCIRVDGRLMPRR